MSSFGFACPPQTILYQTPMWHGQPCIILYYSLLPWIIWCGMDRGKKCPKTAKEGKYLICREPANPFPCQHPHDQGLSRRFLYCLLQHMPIPFRSKSHVPVQSQAFSKFQPGSSQMKFKWQTRARSTLPSLLLLCYSWCPSVPSPRDHSWANPKATPKQVTMWRSALAHHFYPTDPLSFGLHTP